MIRIGTKAFGLMNYMKTVPQVFSTDLPQLVKDPSLNRPVYKGPLLSRYYQVKIVAFGDGRDYALSGSRILGYGH